MAEAILYSFRRCPYAMRARMALHVSGLAYEHREVVLRDKPAAMLEVSPKGTVPVFVTAEGEVLEESLDIMRHGLAQNDPEDWLGRDDQALVATNDGPFKHHLDRYKYASRYEAVDPEQHRAAAVDILAEIDRRLAASPYLCDDKPGFADIAIFPFVRQFANHDRERFDADLMPHLQAWLQALVSSELFAAIMTKYPKWEPVET
ncbi:glutathione S-transferase [Qipengyuania sp. XHP0211]|uniref:glutathione S-transferase n=1 Tax=Qipengyuania sp. XHP0211 TaxID=3038079 RepID=UPI00241C9F45|nr:glutathione S-transferase [Qipengyuania sp. XHP0211]MDG5749914.1 glutathione S-transferase [Qipengyuania sp. XHP0211]